MPVRVRRSAAFGAAAEQATAGRTAGWLDQMVDAGHLTAEQRVRLAAEDGAVTLTRLLRRAELAGHDPHRVLLDAIISRPLDGARQITNVLHKRITETVTLDPIGDSFADWTPRVEDPGWRTYLAALAAAADTRRAQLGAEVAKLPPQWAVEALGPVPDEEVERGKWTDRAAAVAAHRELTGHDDAAVALGPKPGQVEAYASWRALGRAEAEMSDGQLYARIRGAEREEAWAPASSTQATSCTTPASGDTTCSSRPPSCPGPPNG